MLLLDEPLGALDLKLRKQMQVELKSIQREVGITFLYVTHDQEEALAMSDRIAVMDHGVVIQCGTPEEVYEQPAKPFVAGFIGISNLMAGMVEDGGVRLANGALCAAPVPEDCAAGARSSSRCGRRRSGSTSTRRAWSSSTGTVAERVYVGTTTQVIVELGPDTRVVALEQNTHVSHASRPLGDRPPGHAVVAAGALARACAEERRAGQDRREVDGEEEPGAGVVVDLRAADDGVGGEHREDGGEPNVMSVIPSVRSSSGVAPVRSTQAPTAGVR